MAEDRFPEVAGFFDHFDVLDIRTNVEFIGVKAFLKRFRDNFLGPFGEDGSFELDTHDELYH